MPFEKSFSHILSIVSSDIELLQTNLAEDAFVDVVESQDVVGPTLVEDFELTIWEVLLELFPELFPLLLTDLVDWLQCLHDHLHLNCFCF